MTDDVEEIKKQTAVFAAICILNHLSSQFEENQDLETCTNVYQKSG